MAKQMMYFDADGLCRQTTRDPAAEMQRISELDSGDVPQGELWNVVSTEWLASWLKFAHPSKREEERDREASERQRALLHLPKHRRSELLVLLDGELNVHDDGALHEQPFVGVGQRLEVVMECVQHVGLALGIRQQQ